MIHIFAFQVDRHRDMLAADDGPFRLRLARLMRNHALVRDGLHEKARDVEGLGAAFRVRVDRHTLDFRD